MCYQWRPGMTINTEGTRTYNLCRNCLRNEDGDLELTPEHYFDYPAILRSLRAIDEFTFQGTFYNNEIVEIARAVISSHGVIWMDFWTRHQPTNQRRAT